MTEEEVERQLSKLFHAAVGDPPDHVSLSGIRRLVVMRRMVMSITVTAGIVLAGCIGLAVSAHAIGSAPGAGHGKATAPLRYYLEDGFRPGSNGQQVVIRATATGAITGTVKCPWPRADVGGSAVAAPETIYLLCLRDRRTRNGPVTTGARIYKFGLTRAGRPVDYRLLPGGAFPDASVGGLAVAADGSEFAVNVIPHRKGASSAIVVVNAKTGARAEWTGTTLPGGVRLTGRDLSLTANGRELAVFGAGRCPKGLRTCKSPGEEMVALSPASKGGQLASGRKIFTELQVTNPVAGYVNDAFLTPDGSAVTIGLVYGGQTSYVAVVQVSARTGKPVRVLYKLNTLDGFSYHFVSADPTGKHVLFDAGQPSGAINGWIDHGKLIRLKPAGDLVNEEVW